MEKEPLLSKFGFLEEEDEELHGGVVAPDAEGFSFKTLWAYAGPGWYVWYFGVLG